MKYTRCLLVLGLWILLSPGRSRAQETPHDTLPVRGFCIAAPAPAQVDSFVGFIRDALVPRHVNTLVLRIDYHYQFKSHPELADTDALSAADAAKIAAACQQSGIRVIPSIDLLGHQSWAGHLGKLLQVYPQFDETPWVKMPLHYKWPNADHLYCKSYCPLAPGLHEVLFDVIDELCDAFHADAFHAGMDEVFYIADPRCPRCGGKDPAALFAGEVTAVRNHLAGRHRQLWIWADRLIDGKTTGMGEWEASMNNTFRAVDMIPKDVVLCDWHYERADPSAAYFAMKGFHVVTCPFANAQTGKWQVEDMYRLRARSTKEMRERFDGILQTVWSDAGSFMRQYYGRKAPAGQHGAGAVDCFKEVFSSL